MVLESHPTFACPHCGAVYPFRPVLVDRAVRCTKCTKPFKVHADRTVEKVEDTAPVPPPEMSRTAKLVRAQAVGKTARLSRPTGAAPPVPSAAATPPSEALTPKVKAEVGETRAGETPGGTAKVAAVKPDPGPVGTSTSAASAAAQPEAVAGGTSRLQTETKKASAKTLNEQQEEMRRRMSASLNTMAGKLAAKDEEAAEPTDMVVPDSTAKAPGAKEVAAAASTAGRERTAGGSGTSARAKAVRKSGGDRKTARVVLTNEGERQYQEERSLRLWVLGVLLVPVLLALLWWCWPNAKGDALRSFAEPPEGNASLHRFPDLVAKRGWMVMPQLALVDAGSFSFAAGSTLPIAGFAEVLTPLHGLVYDADHAIWTAPDKADAIAQAWSRASERSLQLKAVAASVGVVVDQAAILQNLSSKGLPPEAAKIIARLVTGRSGDDGHAWLADLIDHPPTQLELAPFSGAGTCIQPGLSVARKPVTYHGVLMRITGPQWPQRWKIWEISAN